MPSYTHVSSGTPVSLNSSGAISPTGSSVVSGNLLLLVSGCRAPSSTVDSAPSGWTQLDYQATNTSIAVYARVADGTATDNPSITWSGTAYRWGWVEQFSGDVYTDLSTIIAGSGADKATEGSSSTTVLLVPALTVSEDNCLVITLGSKQKTSTSDGNTFAAPSGFTETREFVESGSRTASAFAYWQQTTKANGDGTNWALTGTSESLAGRGTIIALKPLSATKYVKLVAPSDAEGETVEGVVLNAARDTVIGEFTSQTFIAGTGDDAGFAVLKIDVADITPDGSTLTTSDTPLISAKNGTYGTVGLPSATVIEE